MTKEASSPVLSAELLVQAYSQGYFPMHHPGEGILWHWPQRRALIPLEPSIRSKRSRKLLADPRWRVTRDHCFQEVITACADRESTWINEEIINAYTELHCAGHAHSVEVWVEQELVGGLYGVHLGAAFFGESMFNRVDDAAKVAFHHLVDHLRARDFQLLDSQYLNEFTASLGAIEVPAERFKEILDRALMRVGEW